MKNIYILFVAVILLAGCSKSNTSKDKFSRMDWLLGSWQADLGKSTFHETWDKISDTFFTANSYELDNEKKTFEEEISILMVNVTPVYRVTINKGKIIDFWMTDQTDTSITFENPENPFPQKITYVQKAADVIYCTADGNERGVYHKEEFLFMNKKQ
ncbi:MAG: DUF6265 family protein [Bacteroidetes bacterium]|nr:DUF6265 family protein [Bacteroidota bacterium]